jgi:hypothetical protein
MPALLKDEELALLFRFAVPLRTLGNIPTAGQARRAALDGIDAQEWEGNGRETVGVWAV